MISFFGRGSSTTEESEEEWKRGRGKEIQAELESEKVKLVMAGDWGIGGDSAEVGGAAGGREKGEKQKNKGQKRRHGYEPTFSLAIIHSWILEYNRRASNYDFSDRSNVSDDPNRYPTAHWEPCTSSPTISRAEAYS